MAEDVRRSAELVVMEDFNPGDIIVQVINGRSRRGPYKVLDPVRTVRGKLRLQGPREGYMTTWWNPNSRNAYYRLEVNGR